MISMSPDHVYTLALPGQPPRTLPANTEILKDRGVIDTRWYTEESRVRGTYVHAVTDLWDRARLTGGDIEWGEIQPVYLGYCTAWRKFCKEVGFTVVLSEQMLWHSADYATTIDKIGYTGSGASLKWLLVEIKTGSVPKWVWLQMALQESALIERLRDGFVSLPGGEKFQTLSARPLKVAVCLKENGTYSVSEGFNINHIGDALAHVRSYHSAREFA